MGGRREVGDDGDEEETGDSGTMEERTGTTGIVYESWTPLTPICDFVTAIPTGNHRLRSPRPCPPVPAACGPGICSAGTRTTTA